jgi:hypothetical protein
MNNSRNFSKYLVFAGLALAMVISATAQQLSQSSAKVVRIKGSARYATANNVWQPLKVGDVLSAGAIVQTAENSRVDLVLGESAALDLGAGSAVPKTVSPAYQPVAEMDFVRIWENSVMAIDKLTVADTGADQIRETQLDLRAGRIFGTVKKLSGGSKYEIKIPNGVAGIRGTVYSISALGVLTVTSGSVVIAYADGTGNVVTQVVSGGQSYDTRTGQFTPIPQSAEREMRSALGDARTGLPPGLQHFPEDHNNHYVSPTTGRPGFQIVPNDN